MNIKLTDIEVTPTEKYALDRGYLYKDLMLDLSTRYSYNAQLNKKEKLNDVQALYDVESIKASIVNAMLTSPGQKILNPEFGVDLRQYLFEPVDEFTTFEIEADIRERLPTWEPRITLEKVSVTANEEDQQYDIDIQINVPSLDIVGLSIVSILNSNGYYIS